jgi:hypothetical protein
VKKSSSVTLTLLSTLVLVGCSQKEPRQAGWDEPNITHGYTNASDTVISYRRHHGIIPYYMFYSRYGYAGYGGYNEAYRGFNRGGMGVHTYSSVSGRSSYAGRIGSSARGGFGHTAVGHAVSS